MSALTERLPDDKHRCLRAPAESRGTALYRLIDDMATVMLGLKRMVIGCSIAVPASPAVAGTRAPTQPVAADVAVSR